MEFYINGNPVGVTPSPSDTLQSLIVAVEKQLEEGLIIVSLMVDGDYIALDDPKSLELAIEGIQKAEMLVATPSEVGINLLEDAKTLLLSSLEPLKSGMLGQKYTMMQSFAWIMESLDALRQSLPFPPADIALLHGAVGRILRSLDEASDETHCMDIAEAIEMLPDSFTRLQEKLQHPEQYTKESVVAVLTQTQEVLPQLAQHFQKGEDFEALSLLGGVIDAVDMYVRFSASDKNEERHQFAEEINSLSSQLLEAFENKDYVLIADLIEYDFNDQLEAILEQEQ
ncbi:MAG: hypothetical protein ACRCY4_07120 [Brevinema sp.]